MEPPKNRTITRRLLEFGTTVWALLAFVVIFYVVARISSILDPVPCLLNDLYGGATAACREARNSVRTDPWAPYVVGAFFLYIGGAITFLLYDSARDRDLKAVGLVVLWIAGLLLILWWH